MTTFEIWLSNDDIAKQLEVSKETDHRWLEVKRIPAHRMGKFSKFKISEDFGWVSNVGAKSDAISDAELK